MDGAQRAVEPVRPGVVAAPERRRATPLVVHQPASPVLTDVVVGGELAVLGPHDQDRLRPEVEHGPAAGLADIACGDGIEPRPAEDPIELAGCDVRRQVAVFVDDTLPEVGIGLLRPRCTHAHLSSAATADRCWSVRRVVSWRTDGDDVDVDVAGVGVRVAAGVGAGDGPATRAEATPSRATARGSRLTVGRVRIRSACSSARAVAQIRLAAISRSSSGRAGPRAAAPERALAERGPVRLPTPAEDMAEGRCRGVLPRGRPRPAHGQRRVEARGPVAVPEPEELRPGAAPPLHAVVLAQLGKGRRGERAVQEPHPGRLAGGHPAPTSIGFLPKRPGLRLDEAAPERQRGAGGRAVDSERVATEAPSGGGTDEAGPPPHTWCGRARQPRRRGRPSGRPAARRWPRSRPPEPRSTLPSSATARSPAGRPDRSRRRSLLMPGRPASHVRTRTTKATATITRANSWEATSSRAASSSSGPAAGSTSTTAVMIDPAHTVATTQSVPHLVHAATASRADGHEDQGQRCAHLEEAQTREQEVPDHGGRRVAQVEQPEGNDVEHHEACRQPRGHGAPAADGSRKGDGDGALAAAPATTPDAAPRRPRPGRRAAPGRLPARPSHRRGRGSGWCSRSRRRGRRRGALAPGGPPHGDGRPITGDLRTAEDLGLQGDEPRPRPVDVEDHRGTAGSSRRSSRPSQVELDDGRASGPRGEGLGHARPAQPVATLRARGPRSAATPSTRRLRGGGAGGRGARRRATGPWSPGRRAQGRWRGSGPAGAGSRAGRGRPSSGAWPTAGAGGCRWSGRRRAAVARGHRSPVPHVALHPPQRGLGEVVVADGAGAADQPGPLGHGGR